MQTFVFILFPFIKAELKEFNMAIEFKIDGAFIVNEQMIQQIKIKHNTGHEIYSKFQNAYGVHESNINLYTSVEPDIHICGH